LLVEPRVEVVADLDEVEAHLLGPDGLPDELLRTERLRGELVPELHDTPPVAGPLHGGTALPGRPRRSPGHPGPPAGQAAGAGGTRRAMASGSSRSTTGTSSSRCFSMPGLWTSEPSARKKCGLPWTASRWLR